VIVGSLTYRFKAALDHWEEVTGEYLLVQDSFGLWNRLKTGTLLWIRISTQQLCIEVNDNKAQDPTSIPWITAGDSILGIHLTSDTNFEEKLLPTITLDDIHNIFWASAQWHRIDIADPGTILLGSLSWSTSPYAHAFNPFSEISLSDRLGLLDVYVEGWCIDSAHCGPSSRNEGFVVLPNGWTRYQSLFFLH
jgi:hypothetical protein